MTQRQRPRPPARIMRAGEVSNLELIGEICRAAVEALPLVSWPASLPAADAPSLVHRWLRDHSQYKEEGALQVVRLPRALVVQRLHDCKSSAVFAASLLRAAGYPVALRFVKQPERPWWSHVYVMAGGFAVDPLLPLGAECDRTARFDYHLP